MLAGTAAALAAPRAGVAQEVQPSRIDVHHHVFPPDYLQVQHDGILAASAAAASTFFTWTPERAMVAMDRSGIAIALTSPPLPGVWTGDVARSRQIMRIYNDGAAEIARRYPARFGLFAALAPPDLDGSEREIDYAVGTLKADGVALFSSYDGKWLGDAAFDPLFAEIDRRKLIVYVHPATPACCNRIMPGVATSTIEFLFDTTRTILSLLYAGTFAKYPHARFIFAHTGGTVADLSYRIAADALRQKDVSARNPDGPFAALRKLYYDIANSANPPAMAAIMNLVPTTQLLFGSDYPYVQIPVTADGMMHVGLSAAQTAALDRGNAVGLFPRLA